MAVCEEDETTPFLTTKVPGFYRRIGFGRETPLPNGRSLFVCRSLDGEEAAP
jgi:hypothetical protein